MFGIGQQELLILLVIALFLFGSAKLPALMRNLGRSANEFKKGMRDGIEDTPESSKHDSVS
jgi:sec-independent protein translocase protein TatA